MKLFVTDENLIVGYEIKGSSAEGIEYNSDNLPDDFMEKFKSSFYLLKNNEISENPDYANPDPQGLGPSKQDKINAQLMLNQAQQKEQQDGFNAQMLLQLAQIKGGNA